MIQQSRNATAFFLDQLNMRQKISSRLLHQWHGRNVTQAFSRHLVNWWTRTAWRKVLGQIKGEMATFMGFINVLFYKMPKFCKSSKLLITVISVFLFADDKRTIKFCQSDWPLQHRSGAAMTNTVFHRFKPMGWSVIPVFFSKTLT